MNANPCNPMTIGAQVGDAAHWVVLLIALVLATQSLDLAGVTGPLGDMLQGFGLTVPRITGAALIWFLGYMLAQVAKKVVITTSHVERLSTQSRTSGSRLVWAIATRQEMAADARRRQVH